MSFLGRERPDRGPQRRRCPHQRRRSRPFPAADAGHDLEHGRVATMMRIRKETSVSTKWPTRLHSTPAWSAAGSTGREEATSLPLTAPWKGSSQLRYEWDLRGDMKAHVQGVVTYEGKRRRDLRPTSTTSIGNLKSYHRGRPRRRRRKGPWSVDLYVKNLFDVRGQIVEGHPVPRGSLRRSVR